MIKKPKPWQKKYYPNKDGTPSVFYVETVLACNLACPECAIGVDVITRNKKILKLSEFEIISKKIEPYAQLVYLHKWGEPFMNKNIVPMIKEVSKYAHPHISTNGHFLDEKKVISEPVKLEQNYRNFDYESPWEGTKYIKEQTKD